MASGGILAQNVSFLSNQAFTYISGGSVTYGSGGAVYIAGLTVASTFTGCNLTSNIAYVSFDPGEASEPRL